MKLSEEKTANGGTMYYVGDLTNKNVLLFVGRDSFKRDDAMVQSLINALYDDQYAIIWYEYRGPSQSRLLNPKNKAWQRSDKMFYFLTHPVLWNKLFLRGVGKYFLNTESIPYRVTKLRTFVRSLGPDRNIFILSRSAGGRISSMIEDEQTVQKCICLGYPFKHPEKEEEPERVRHLATMTKPFLIIQGMRDEYGGTEAIKKYPLSPQIHLIFKNTDHNFEVTDEEMEKVVEEIKNFIRA